MAGPRSPIHFAIRFADLSGCAPFILPLPTRGRLDPCWRSSQKTEGQEVFL
jgi:hypothetical protein